MLLLRVSLELFRCRFVPLLEPNPTMLARFAPRSGSKSHPPLKNPGSANEYSKNSKEQNCVDWTERPQKHLTVKVRRAYCIRSVYGRWGDKFQMTNVLNARVV